MKRAKCEMPGCRRKATTFVGKDAVCTECIPAAMERKAKKNRKRTVTIKAGPGKAGQDAMTALLLAMGAGGGKK